MAFWLPDRLLSPLRSTRALPALSLMSQALGAAQLVLLGQAGAFGAATDAFLFLFSVAQLPSQLILVGVWYPLVLNRKGSPPRWTRRARFWAPFGALVSSVVGYLVMLATGRNEPGLALLATLVGVNGLVSTILWFDTLWLATKGRAGWNAAIAAPANALACVVLGALVLLGGAPLVVVTAMTGALAVGNLALLAVLRSRPLMGDLRAALDQPVHDSTGTGWYLARATAGFGATTLLQTMTLGLAASAVTVVTVIMRIVSGATTAAVQVVLPRLVHVDSEHPEDAYRFLNRLIQPLAIALVGVLIAAPFTHSRFVGYAGLTLGWTFGGFTSAALHRVSYRFLPATSSSILVISAGLVVAVTCGISIAGNLTIFSVLLSLAALELLPAGWMALRLGRRLLALECGAAAAVALTAALI